MPRGIVPRAVVLLAMLATLALAGCVSVGDTGIGRPTAGTATLPPPPTLSAVMAPAPTRVVDEVTRLSSFGPHPGARLRAAWLLQQQGSYAEAETHLNTVLFGTVDHGADVDALARLLRARGYLRAGDDRRAARDLADALEVAVAPDLRARIRAEAGAGAGSAGGGRAAGLALESPKILPRSAWRAAAARSSDMRPMTSARRITVHHSATLVSSTSIGTAIGAIRGIQRYHQTANGWGDIGYHFLIDPAGRVWTGRPLQWQGAHAGDNEKNEANIGICLLGNFVRDAQGSPPRAQLRTLEALVATLCRRYDVPPDQVLTHQELKTTDCPGPYVQAAVERIRERLAGVALSADAASH